MERRYILEGLDCPNCAMKIERALNKRKEINKASVNAATLNCEIEYNEFNEEIEKDIIQLIEKLEDEVHVVKKKMNHHHEECECGHCHDHEEKRYILEGLDCPNCAMKIEKALNDRKEIEKASVNAATLICEIHYKEYSEEIEREIIDLIEEIEDEVHVVKKEAHHIHEKHSHKTESNKKDLKKIKWKIEGLDCANCALKVEEAVNSIQGVDDASLNFTTKSLIIYIDSHIDEKKLKEQIKKAILDTEEVTILEENEKQEKKLDMKMVVIPIGIAMMILGIALKNNWLIIVSYFLIGYSVILKALKNIKRKEIFDENFLMVIATIGALVVGEYLEAVAVMLFYQVGEYFQDRAVEKSRKSIADLMNIKSEIAHVKVNGELKDVDPEELGLNDVVVVQPGERIPLDGIVMKGNSSLDTSALTGEPIPREITVNDEVLAGCINLNGVLEVKVTHEASQSTVSRILDMVENASSKKAKTELKMTRFARIYTPFVVLSAIILAIVPNFFQTGVEWQEWLLRACTFLVISCPCALVLSIPLGYFAGIGSASKKGILVKGGNYLEILSQIDTIVFDKTGTLTNGTFTVTHIYAEDQKNCLKLAAIAESYSNHPIGLSIQKEYGQKMDEGIFENVEEIAGYGIKGEYQNKVLLVGNKKLMDHYDIQVNEVQSIGTLVYVAYDCQFIGTIEISDTLKPNTIESLKELKNKGIKKLVMLTGDRKQTALEIAEQCGLDEVHYELLPTDKVEEFEKILTQTTGKVAFVGDGINDAPVLARSDLGIAMGGLGSEAAVEASDLVLMKDDISALSKGIDLARYTQKIMNENIIFILAVKAIILILSIFGYANMWLGVFADVGVSLLAVLNAMRIIRK